MLLDLLRVAPWAFAILAFVLLWSLALHELGHAWVADRFGDKTARNLGRLTLNPLKHLEPLGTLLIFLVGFGWARPVPIRPENFSRYRAGLFCVSLAGVAVNLLIAALALWALALLGVRINEAGEPFLREGARLRLLDENLTDGVFRGLWWSARINLVLVVFNLLPIPPLDGAKALQALAPAGWQRALWRLERYGFLLVLALLLLFRDQIGALITTLSNLLIGLVLG